MIRLEPAFVTTCEGCLDVLAEARCDIRRSSTFYHVHGMGYYRCGRTSDVCIDSPSTEAKAVSKDAALCFDFGHTVLWLGIETLVARPQHVRHDALRQSYAQSLDTAACHPQGQGSRASACRASLEGWG
nr:hypothetical protein CFP56_01444 [Quercus suber]